jgi:hypothetical protein
VGVVLGKCDSAQAKSAEGGCDFVEVETSPGTTIE